jgi:hypothetical protein
LRFMPLIEQTRLRTASVPSFQLIPNEPIRINRARAAGRNASVPRDYRTNPSGSTAPSAPGKYRTNPFGSTAPMPPGATRALHAITERTQSADRPYSHRGARVPNEPIRINRTHAAGRDASAPGKYRKNPICGSAARTAASDQRPNPARDSEYGGLATPRSVMIAVTYR